ncbi:GH21898 [Drosophila grimshawi]|uniref:GH21898 n=2 Tax=Drosophila grimshawi TaxID=7222 RepID=B4J831_DROGR|nr:GH21898 [Drosophila grimshawi]
MILTLGCCLSTYSSSGPNYAIGWGLIYLAAIHTFAFLSGAHLNPAVSATATIVGVMEWQLMLCYWLVQLLGALVGFGMAYVAMPNKSGKICLTTLGNYDEVKLMGIELFMMMMFLFAYCGIWDKRSESAYDSVSARVGFIFAALCCASAYYTGGTLNFYRSLAPAIVHVTFGGLWCIFVAHLLATIVVALLWRFLIAAEEPQPME